MNGPLNEECPVCNAAPGHPCNVPTDTGRRNVTWVHMRREIRAQTNRPPTKA